MTSTQWDAMKGEEMAKEVLKFKIKIATPDKPGGKCKYTIQPSTQRKLLPQECAEKFGVICYTARLTSKMARHEKGTKFTDRCLEALEKLQGVPVTYNLLQSTKAYHKLKGSLKHPVAAISQKAVKILKAWRKLKHAVKRATNKAIPKECKPGEQDEALDPRRLQIRQRIVEALCKVPKELPHLEEWRRALPIIDISKVARDVECQLFLKLGPMLPTGPARHQYRAILFNLREQRNPKFRHAVLLGRIKPQQVPTLKHEDMAHEELKQHYDMLELKQKRKQF